MKDSPGPASRGWSGVRVLVLGSTGFVGRWVARALHRRGAEVVPHARDGDRARSVLAGIPGGDHPVLADLSHEDRVVELLRTVSPSVVFNLAGYGVDRGERDEEMALRLNDALVGGLARATARHAGEGWDGVRLVHAGSALEYGRANGNLSEDTVAEPTTMYGRSKLAGTLRLRRFARERGLPALTARLFTVFGPGEHDGRLLPTLVSAAATGATVDLTAGRQERDFTYVEDVAEGLLRLARSPVEPGEIVNLATGRLTSVRDFVRRAADVLDLSDDQLRFGTLPTREEEMAHEPVTIRRLRDLTGWRPRTSIRAGVRRTVGHLGAPPEERRWEPASGGGE